jgi:tRNA(fMet)-specific endonuclease VapC
VWTSQPFGPISTGSWTRVCDRVRARVARHERRRKPWWAHRLGKSSDPVSAITLAELSVGPLVATTDEDRSARQSVLQQVEADFHPIPFDDRAARAFGRVAAELRASGRKTIARAYDALIAATAAANDLPVFTRNPDDFAGIGVLTVVRLEVAP